MNYEDTNVVHLRGVMVSEPEFSHSVYGEGFYELKIEVPRLSEQKDVLPVTMSERLLSMRSIKVGDELAIIGQFRSYNKMTDNKSKLMLTVFALSFEDEPSENPNTIELQGYICKPPVYRMTPFKREICDVLLAVNRAYNKSDYIPCIAWGRNARFVQSITVGEKLIVHGRIQSREYQKRISETEVETRVAYEVSIGRIERDQFVPFEKIETNVAEQV